MRPVLSRRFALAVAAVAALVVTGGSTASLAQVLGLPAPTALGPGSGPNAPSGNPDRLDPLRYNLMFRNVTPSRLLTAERLEFEAIDLERRRRRMSPTEIRADINAQLAKAGIVCAVRSFKRVGMTPNAQSIYETACEGGPGYMLVNGVEPSATSCLVLAGAASAALRRDPNARAGAQCTLPENQKGHELIGGWAREAGLACKVDQAEWLGASDAGLDVYEVGCEGSEGFWLEKATTGWSLRGCLQVRAEGLNCRFTDETEQRAWMRARLVGTPAQGCDVAEIRVVGVSSQGSHFETRCSTPGEGYMLRIARDGPAEDVKPCAELAGRALACALTVSARSSAG